MAVGEEQGVGYILDIVEPGQASQPRHYLIPHATASKLKPEDLIYLGAKGVFSLPSERVCDALLKSYFHNVHPILPIIDAKKVLSAYHNEGLKRVNLLLMWSMFSVATNVCAKSEFLLAVPANAL
jgi:hypothetical protein